MYGVAWATVVALEFDAVGVALWVEGDELGTMDGLVSSTERLKQAYCERYRLADRLALAQLFLHILLAIYAILTVLLAEGQANGQALIDLPNIASPLPAQAVSL
ncbi:MAG: hypothetical protein IPP76_12045 [Moraxellaceae bacterium]|nr:hypothetical protein [Moraxellaceae bacterium]